MKETILKINLNHFDEDGPFVMAVTYSFLSDWNVGVDEARESLSHCNCYCLGVLKGGWKDIMSTNEERDGGLQS